MAILLIRDRLTTRRILKLLSCKKKKKRKEKKKEKERNGRFDLFKQELRLRLINGP